MNSPIIRKRSSNTKEFFDGDIDTVSHTAQSMDSKKLSRTTVITLISILITIFVVVAIGTIYYLNTKRLEFKTKRLI